MWCSACEIRGRLRCSAASVGYRGRIWKAFVHSPVTLLSRNLCQARNYRPRGIPSTKGGGETVRARTRETRSALTAHEAQISELARDGLSNPEIGARLFISPRTVQYRLPKVFARLCS